MLIKRQDWEAVHEKMENLPDVRLYKTVGYQACWVAKVRNYW